MYKSGKTAFYSLLRYRAKVLGWPRLSYFESLICTVCICMPPTLSSPKSTSESVSRSREIYSGAGHQQLRHCGGSGRHACALRETQHTRASACSPTPSGPCPQPLRRNLATRSDAVHGHFVASAAAERPAARDPLPQLLRLPKQLCGTPIGSVPVR